MFKLLFYISFVALAWANALNKNEIENIRRELNNELTQLETATIKRSDNNEVNSVQRNDADVIGELLKHDGSKSIVDDIAARLHTSFAEGGVDKKWDAMVLAKKSADTRIKQNMESIDAGNSKKSSDDELDALLKLMSNEEKKKSKRVVEDEAFDELLKVLKSRDDNKREINTKRVSNYIGEEKECEDHRVDCHNYKDYCEEPAYRLMMRERCPLTCGVCKVCKKDVWSKDRCDMIVEARLCQNQKYFDRIKENCYRSCGHCRAHSPPACSFDPQGCCWDGKTKVSEGCQACEDNRQNANICKNLLEECTNKHLPGKWMRENCPVACGMCDPKKECHDYKRYREQCIKWEKANQCHQEHVQQICPRTCNLCHKRKIITDE